MMPCLPALPQRSKADAPPELWSEDAFFAVRTKEKGGHPQVRLLYDDHKKSKAADGWYDHAIMYNFPFLRNIPGITYAGQFPFARLAYEDDALPVTLALDAFSPFIPCNEKDSAIPLAFFVFTVTNRTNKPCETSLLFSMRNCAGYDLDALTLRHDVRHERGMTGVLMTKDAQHAAGRTQGTTLVAALNARASCLPAWTDARGLVGIDNPGSPGMCQLFYPFRDRGELGGGARQWARHITRQPDTPADKAALHETRAGGSCSSAPPTTKAASPTRSAALCICGSAASRRSTPKRASAPRCARCAGIIACPNTACATALT
jgi:hypothetical protein